MVAEGGNITTSAYLRGSRSEERTIYGMQIKDSSYERKTKKNPIQSYAYGELGVHT
jgi:hypothetical protein